MAEKFTDVEIEEALTKLGDWRREGDELVADFTFSDFRTAFGFMAEMALWAEKLNHHPTWENTYNRVGVRLSTHDANGITGLDFDLATHMSAAAARS